MAMEATALLGMAPFLYIEACTVTEYGPRRWLSVWNLMDLATYFLQVHVFQSHVDMAACTWLHNAACTWLCCHAHIHMWMQTCLDAHMHGCTHMDMVLYFCEYMALLRTCMWFAATVTHYAWWAIIACIGAVHTRTHVRPSTCFSAGLRRLHINKEVLDTVTQPFAHTSTHPWMYACNTTLF